MNFVDFMEDNSSLIFEAEKNENEEKYTDVYSWEIKEANDEFEYYVEHTNDILKDSHCAFGVFINCILGFVEIKEVKLFALFNKFEQWYFQLS